MSFLIKLNHTETEWNVIKEPEVKASSRKDLIHSRTTRTKFPSSSYSYAAEVASNFFIFV